MSEPGAYARALGPRFDALPAGWRALHSAPGRPVFSGNAAVTRGKHPLSGPVSDLFGFPLSSESVAVRLEIDRSGPCEYWVRTFGRRSYRSRIRLQGAPGEGRVAEKMGAIEAQMRLMQEGNGVELALESARMAGLPLPVWLTPVSRAREYQDEKGRFCFDVDIGLPGIGRLVHYQGWLSQVSEGGK